MECAAPSSFLVTLPFKAFSECRFSGAPGSTVFAISWFASKPGRNFKTQTVVVGLQMWESRQRFPHPQTICGGWLNLTFPSSCQVCWRTMRWHNGRSRRSRNLHSENACQGSVIKKDEGAAHSIQARRSLLQQRPDTFAQTYSVILILRLQNGGGPYIPCSR